MSLDYYRLLCKPAIQTAFDISYDTVETDDDLIMLYNKYKNSYDLIDTRKKEGGNESKTDESKKDDGSDSSIVVIYMEYNGGEDSDDGDE